MTAAMANQVLTMGTGGIRHLLCLWLRVPDVEQNIRASVVPQVTGASRSISSAYAMAIFSWASQNDTIFYAYNGDKDQLKAKPLTTYAIGVVSAVQLVVAADSDIKGPDLKGKKVSIGARLRHLHQRYPNPGTGRADAG